MHRVITYQYLKKTVFYLNLYKKINSAKFNIV